MIHEVYEPSTIARLGTAAHFLDPFCLDVAASVPQMLTCEGEVTFAVSGSEYGARVTDMGFRVSGF